LTVSRFSHSFWMSTAFRGELLVPAVENLLCRAKVGWDNYDNNIYGNFNLFSMI
jgi:hypothetical protein